MTVGPRVSESILTRLRRRLGLTQDVAEAKMLRRNLRDVKRKLAAKRRAEGKRALTKARRAALPKKKAA